MLKTYLNFYLSIVILAFGCKAQAQAISDSTGEATQHYIIQKGETLYEIANRFDLGLTEIMRANPKISSPHSIRAEQKIILPILHLAPDVPHKGIVINLSEPRLYYFLKTDESYYTTFPVTIGADQKTPIGKTKVLRKREHPSWTPPDSVRAEDPTLPAVMPPGPKNPLGDYALDMDWNRNAKWQGIMIHGTNNPFTIGNKISHGCIRLYPQDIKILFDNVEIGTTVMIVEQPIKIQEIEDKIYIEVHLTETPDQVPESLGVRKMICDKVKDCDTRIDWEKVDGIVMENSGVPTEVTVK